MASTSAVWGIDIGNSSLKALRCRPSAEPGKIEALAFDYIEHSKILTQPGADPGEILAETLQSFLSRNSTRGDQVAISVSGQNTISRFLKLPPVDPKKIPEIIKYEAKQWLPFDLADVIWDFQSIGAPASGDSSIPLDFEVGMFAMKRDIALKTLAPYDASGIDIDSIQSSPLALYNFATFDQLPEPNFDEYDPDNPPESIVLLCVGTEATDVVVTNGYTIWTRSIAIGGNVFTKALTKSLKLTSSKAEYLKRHAAAAEDPKAVFQAMKPVFNDMLSEVHRSLEYYQNLNRKVRYKRIVALGNTMKMPGLRQFLTQNLGYEVTRLPRFSKLVGPEVTEAPLFQENMFSFAVSYGLAIQQLGEAPLSTNLIPKEIVMDRVLREKKPWALLSAAILILGFVLYFAGASRALGIISSGAYQGAERQADSVTSYSKKMQDDTTAAISAFNTTDNVGKNLVSGVEGRIVWLELLKAINACMPTETEMLGDKTSEEITQQNRLFISSVEAITIDSLATWFAPLKQFEKYYPDDEEILDALRTAGKNPTLADVPDDTKSRLELIPGPTPPADTSLQQRVVQVVGYHYHNPATADKGLPGDAYLREVFLKNLKFKTISLPPSLEMQNRENPLLAEEVTMAELGISYPTVLLIQQPVATEVVNPKAILDMYIEQMNTVIERERTSARGGGGGSFAGGFNNRSNGRNSALGNIGLNLSRGRGYQANLSDEERNDLQALIGADQRINLRRFDFVVQFAWVVTPPSVREERKRKELEAMSLQTLANVNPASLEELTEGIEIIDDTEDNDMFGIPEDSTDDAATDSVPADNLVTESSETEDQ